MSQIITGLLFLVLGILIYVDPYVYGHKVPTGTGVFISAIGFFVIFFQLIERFKSSKGKT